MPTLQITRAGLAPEHAAATLDYVTSIMLWPLECDMRTEFQRTCAAGRRAAAAVAVPGLAAEPGLYSELEDILPPRILKKELQPQLGRGFRVGEFYASACGLTAWERPGKPISIKQLRGQMTTEARRKAHPAMDVGDKLLERDLHDFRSVATLWAAGHISMAENLGLFCPKRISEFLSLSEWVRAKLLQGLTKKGDPLLPGDVDIWRVPPFLTLPSVSLKSLPMMS